MIDLDYGPAAVAIVIAIAFVLPFLYSFVVDNYDKRNKQIKDSER